MLSPALVRLCHGKERQSIGSVLGVATPSPARRPGAHARYGRVVEERNANHSHLAGRGPTPNARKR